MIVEMYFAEILKLILTMTFAGSAISILLFAIKPAIKNKLPKSFQYYMWFSAVLALMLPISKIVKIPVTGTSAASVKFTHGIGQRTDSFPHIIMVVFVFWQCGIILILGFHMASYMLYVRKLKKYNVNASWQETALLYKLSPGRNMPRLYKNSMAATPVLLGIFRPAIILPDKKYEERDLCSIFMHEITHMKRYDIAVKWLLIFVGALHWFNPIIHFVRREMDKSCELACDEAVIKKLDNEERWQYGSTLIGVAADTIKKMPASITMFESKKSLKERLGAIMEYKKYSKKTVITASLFLGLIVCGIFGLVSLNGTEKEKAEWVINNMAPSDQKRYKEIKLKESLCAFEKNDIVDAYVYLGESGENITNATILVICQEKNPSPEMKSGILSLASEKLSLDAQDIRIDYLDVDTFTSPDAQEIYLD